MKDCYRYTYFDARNIRSKNTDREISRNRVFIILVVMRPDRFDAGFHKIPICFVNMLYSGAWRTNEVIFLDVVRGVRSRHVCQEKKEVPIDRSSLMQEVSVLRNRVPASFFLPFFSWRIFEFDFSSFLLSSRDRKGSFLRRSILFYFLSRVSLASSSVEFRGVEFNKNSRPK